MDFWKIFRLASFGGQVVKAALNIMMSQVHPGCHRLLDTSFATHSASSELAFGSMQVTATVLRTQDNKEKRVVLLTHIVASRPKYTHANLMQEAPPRADTKPQYHAGLKSLA